MMNEPTALGDAPVTVGVLRRKFTINRKVDRGTNPDGTRRDNDLHFTRAEKLAARAARHGD